MSVPSWIRRIVVAAVKLVDKNDSGMLDKILKKRKKFMAIKMVTTTELATRKPLRRTDGTRKPKARKTLVPSGPVAPKRKKPRAALPEPTETAPPQHFYYMTTANVAALNHAVAAGKKVLKSSTRNLLERIDTVIGKFETLIDLLDSGLPDEQYRVYTTFFGEYKSCYSTYYAISRMYTLSYLCESHIRTSMQVTAANMPMEMLSHDNLSSSSVISHEEIETMSMANGPDETHDQTVEAVEMIVASIDSRFAGSYTPKEKCQDILGFMRSMQRKVEELHRISLTSEGQIGYVHRVCVNLDK